ncbi:hypothetical protein [Pedobacter sp. UBA5917]|jgi:hypothetical protein|uniref:hypothetical protein n=1 Tax=Pedobacter sp. UBA5917 TaxID=1947061 RepID=UPI0025E6ABB5|nr:hypothetical protein [Pedobacter sp. UBA5917]
MDKTKLFKFREGVVYFRFFLWTVFALLILISCFLQYEQNSPLLIIPLSVFVLINWIINFRCFVAVVKGIPAIEFKNGFVFDFQSGVVIDWEEIKTYGLVKGYLSSFVELRVKNRRKYLNQTKNPVVMILNLFSLNKEIIVFSINMSLLETDGNYFISEHEKLK